MCARLQVRECVHVCVCICGCVSSSCGGANPQPAPLFRVFATGRAASVSSRCSSMTLTATGCCSDLSSSYRLHLQLFRLPNTHARPEINLLYSTRHDRSRPAFDFTTSWCNTQAKHARRWELNYIIAKTDRSWLNEHFSFFIRRLYNQWNFHEPLPSTYPTHLLIVLKKQQSFQKPKIENVFIEVSFCAFVYN